VNNRNFLKALTVVSMLFGAAFLVLGFFALFAWQHYILTWMACSLGLTFLCGYIYWPVRFYDGDDKGKLEAHLNKVKWGLIGMSVFMGQALFAAAVVVSTYVMSTIYIIAGCALTIGAVWIYWQTRANSKATTSQTDDKTES
tara:strand:+ start:392 stop:817 length:426 start_codon:yes stop_codon:yes gene_type:complete